MIDAARVFIADAAERVEHEAKRAVAAVHEGDMLTTQLAVLKRFGKARAGGYHRLAPARRRRRAVAGPLPVRRALSPQSPVPDRAAQSDLAGGISCTQPDDNKPDTLAHRMPFSRCKAFYTKYV